MSIPPSDGHVPSGAEGHPSVSLVMATWNGARHLPEQLESLRRQTMTPIELIVSDDASTDETMDMLHRFSAECAFPVHVRRQEARLGYELNFASAVRNASGDLLLFVDQDDVWHERKAEALSRFARHSCAKVINHDIEFFRSPGEPLIESYFTHLSELGLPPEINIKGCSLGVTRAFVAQWGLPPARSKISHDFWFAFLGSAIGERSFVRERLIRHRIHDTNASGWIPGADDQDPELRDFLAKGRAAPLDRMLELFVKRWRRGWIAPLQRALRRNASPSQRDAAEAAIERLGLVERWHHARERESRRTDLRRILRFRRTTDA